MKKKKLSTPKPIPQSAPAPAAIPASAPAAAPSPRFGVRRIALGLALLTFLVYFRAILNDWTNFDDNVYVTENPTTLLGLTPDNIWWALSGWHAAFWQPLVWLSYQLEVSIVHWNPFGLFASIWTAAPLFHLTNVLCHTADTVLLVLLVRSLTGTVWRSAFVAALFALHPLHVESVAWITERKDVLSAGFFFASLLAYVRYTRAKPGERTKPYLATLGLFFLGLMAKPMLVTLPCVMFLLDFWPLKRGWKFEEKIPFFLLALAGAIVAVFAVADYNDLRPLSAYPIDVRIWNSIETYCAYMRQMVWPQGLIAFYLYPTSFNPIEITLEALLLAAFSGLAIWQRQRRPWIAFGWFWFLGTLVPVIGIVKTGAFARADRYTYIPLVGLFLILAWALAEIAGNDDKRRRLASLAAATVVTICAVLTFVQIGQWAGTVPLFSRMIEIGGTENALAHYNLGLGYYDAQKTEPNPEVAHADLLKAEAEFRQAFRIRPDYCQAHNNLGIVLMLLGRDEESFQNFEIAARLDPTHVPALDNYGHGLMMRGRYPEAEVVLRRAITLAPGDTRAHFSLADTYALSGRQDQALAELNFVVNATPENVEARRKFAILLAKSGRAEAAAQQFGLLAQQFPGDAGTRSNHGFLLLQAGHPAEAEAELREALRLQPGIPEAHNNLGLALAALGRADEALAEFHEALRLRPGYPEAQANIARALKRP